MKRIIVLLLFAVLFNGFCFSQNFEILDQNTEYSFRKAPKEFYFISSQLDDSKGIKVAEMKFYARDKGERISLVPVFYSLWKNANKLGANSFFINEITYDSEEKKYDITAVLYFLDEDEIDENLGLYPDNLIVIIGNVNTSNDEKKGKSFKLNKEKCELYPFQYMTHQNEVGEEVTLQVGGVLGGTKITIRGVENKLPQFYSVGGVSVTPTIGAGGGGGIAFRSGTISQLDMNLGLFLMEVLKIE